jgi:hypothetical protein
MLGSTDGKSKYSVRNTARIVSKWKPTSLEEPVVARQLPPSIFTLLGLYVKVP